MSPKISPKEQNPKSRAAGSTEEQLLDNSGFWAIRAAPVPIDQAGGVICSCWPMGDPSSWLLPDVILHLSSHQHLAFRSLGYTRAEKQLSFCKRPKKRSFVPYILSNSFSLCPHPLPDPKPTLSHWAVIYNPLGRPKEGPGMLWVTLQGGTGW